MKNNKKNLLLIILAAIIVGTLLFISFTSSPSAPPVSQTPQPTPVEKTAVLYFNPKEISVVNGQPQTVELMVEAEKEAITAAQAQIKYDPSLLSGVTLTIPKENFLGTESDYMILEDSIDEEQGIINVAIAVGISSTPKKGSGVLATITFTPTLTSEKSKTSLTFVPQTLVTREKEMQSILERAIPLFINLKQ